MKNNLEKLVEKCDKEVASFFNLPHLDYKIKILMNRAEIDKTKGYKTQNWVCGFTKDNTVYILDEDNWETESVHPKKNFRYTLKHEICHIYIKLLNSCVPNWLNEGTAIFIAEQVWISDYPREITLEMLEGLDKYDPEKSSHQIGATTVRRIVKKYGKNKLLELIKIDNKNELYKELDTLTNKT